MQSLGQLGTFAFYAALVLSALYFLHKVLWFVRFRKLQAELVGDALSRMGRTADATLLKWDLRAGDSFREANGGRDESPEAYVERIGREITEAREQSEASLMPLSERIVDAVLARELRATSFKALTLERVRSAPIEVGIEAQIPAMIEPKEPDASIFELSVRSRYGVKRRLLTFFLGAADIVYSANHVARMSQNVGLPLSVILRRASLILLILVAIFIDVTTGVRPFLVEKARAMLGDLATGEGFFAETLPSVLGSALWLAGYGVIYGVLFIYLFKRSLDHKRKLEGMQREFTETLASLRAEHRQRLAEWAREYGTMLDDAARATLKQALMLYDRATEKARRRLASPELLTHADAAARAFFARLPESSQVLVDVATERKHSLLHLLWPRPEEMEYQVRQAQYRAAFQHLDVSSSELRGPRPDPKKAEALWRSLVAYARMFPEVLAEEFREGLKTAYDQSLDRVVDNIERDLRALDRQLGELGESLLRTFNAAGPLIESRVEFESDNLHAELSRYVSSVVRVREQARLEAMAFEI